MITIIIPVYNSERYLRQCIESVLSQSYIDYEMLLVNDGSTDNSGKLCEEYAKKDKRITVIHQMNLGQSAARNHAINIAKGEYICFIDSDDVIHPHMLEYLQEVARSRPNSVIACGAEEDEEYRAEVFENSLCPHIYEYGVGEEDIINLLKLPYICWTVWGKLFPRDIITRHLFSEGRFFEDNAIILKWLFSSEGVVIIDKKLYFYRNNNQGTTKGEWTLKKEQDLIWSQEERLRFFLDKKMFQLVESYYSTFLLSAANSYIKYKKKAFSKKPIKRNALRKWWEKYSEYGNLTQGQKQLLFSVIYPIRESLYEWMLANRRRRK